MDCEASRLTEVISLVALSTCPPLLATLTLTDTLTQAQQGNIIGQTYGWNSIALCPESVKRLLWPWTNQEHNQRATQIIPGSKLPECNMVPSYHISYPTYMPKAETSRLRPKAETSRLRPKAKKGGVRVRRAFQIYSDNLSRLRFFEALGPGSKVEWASSFSDLLR